ncbi:MAG TPA: hypothetical protein PKE05_10175 [Microthrixaceae bacterium]|mgnify:CR=1 FL=1|nr:hypothetical protein [Microthrixaceae bacterium]
MSIHSMGRAAGNTAFVGFVPVIIGFFQAAVGLVAPQNDEFFVVRQERVFTFDSSTWGWIHLILGSDIQHNSDPG